MGKLWIEDSNNESVYNGHYEDKNDRILEEKQEITQLDRVLKNILGVKYDRKISRNSKQVKSTKRTVE